MKHQTKLKFAASVVSGLLATTPAYAEMGTVQATPGHFYTSLTTGYVHSDGIETLGHGSEFGIGPLRSRVSLEADDGRFIGGSIGYVFAPTLFNLTNARIEVGYTQTKFGRDIEQSPGGGLLSVNGNAGFSDTVNPYVSNYTRKTHDGHVALKGDMLLGEASTATVGIETFVRHDKSVLNSSMGQMGLGQLFNRLNLGTDYYGAIAVFQPEVKIADDFALVGDFGVGLYRYNAKGNFSTLPSISLKVVESGVGVRTRAIAGVKATVHENVTVTAFGGVDFWSKVAVANMTGNPGTPSSIKTSDLIELKVGLMVTVALQ